MLKKYKPNGNIEFTPVYLNLTTKTVINYKLSLENASQICTELIIVQDC